MNMILFENRVFADMIKLRGGHQSGPLIQYKQCPYIRGRWPCEDTEIQGECYVEMDAEITVMHLQDKECQ